MPIYNHDLSHLESHISFCTEARGSQVVVGGRCVSLPFCTSWVTSLTTGLLPEEQWYTRGCLSSQKLPS